MRHTLRLSLRYLLHYRLRTAILVVCIGLIFFLPIAVSLLVDHFRREMGARAARIPLIAGAKGSRYDLVLNALYFRGRVPDPLPRSAYEAIRDGGLGFPVPVYVRHTVKGFPVVGTTLDYFSELGLTVREGTLPLRLGDAVAGAKAAEALGLSAGGRVITDVEKLYDISSTYPLRLRITGILAESHSPDDGAIFVDVKTSWIIDGIGHGHVSPKEAKETSNILQKKEGEVVFNDALVKYVEITPENLASFHFHGDPHTFPLTAVLVWPRDAKSKTILKGRYAVSKTAQMLEPEKVIAELMGFVFRIKRFFDANFVLVIIATALFLALIVLLSLRIRKREMETLMKIGCSRFTVFGLQAAELTIVLAAGLLLAGVLSGATFWYVVQSHMLL